MGGIIATSITIGAFVVAYGQYVTQSKIENARQAKQSYYDFMEISMNNPLFSKPGLRDEPLSDLEYEGFYWYMQIMSQTLEQVFEFVPDEESWNYNALLQFRLHCGYFLSVDYLPEVHSEHFQNLVEEALDIEAEYAKSGGIELEDICFIDD
jgi:hypothetical protein